MDVTGRGAAGGVASPSRLAADTHGSPVALGTNMAGPAATNYGDMGSQYPALNQYQRQQGELPADTDGPVKFYRVDKLERFPNTAGIQMGQNPVRYNPMLSRVVDGVGKGPSVPLSSDDKFYPNASWRHEFNQWSQRFPAGPRRPGEGAYLYQSPYYPGNQPSQLLGGDTTGNAAAGIGTTPRSASPAFVMKGGRGMRGQYQNRQTRLAPSISYSSVTQTLGSSIFTEGPLGTGGISGG